MMELIPIFGIIFSSVTTVLIVYFISRARSRRAEVQAEVQTRLIDRFGSAPELIEFLQSPVGKQFVSGVQSAPAVLARERILSGFTRAIVLTMLGLAFVGLTILYGEYDNPLPFFAAVFLALGIGYLLATFVTWRLSRQLHGADLFQQPADQTVRS
jgi:hypothetical protein